MKLLLDVAVSLPSCLLLLSLIVRAQAQAPLARRRLAFVQVGTTLYLQGGFDTNTFVSQSNSLDLSSSWTTSSPAWTLLKDGPLTSHHALVAVRPQYAAGLGGGKQGYLLTIGGLQATTFWNLYDIQAQTWSVPPTTVGAAGAVAPPYPGLEGHATAVDPNTGYVYIVGGYFGNTTFNTLTVFDPSTRTMVSQQPATAAASLTDVAVVWSTLRNTVLTFGGSRAPPAVRAGLDMKTLREYDPATKTWKTMVTSGTVPTPRLDHCAAASEDGSKIVVFGGSLDTKTYHQDIYILDVSTATWKSGPPATVPRTRMACGFYSGQFIAWGGSSADNRTTTMHNNTPLVYDTETDAWTTQYTFKGIKSDPSQPSSLPPPPPSSDGSSTAESNKNLGPVIGGAIAAIVALCGCALAIFIVYQRKKRDKLGHYQNNDRMAASLTSEEDDYYRKGRGPPGGGVQDYPDSDIERSTTGGSEQHLRRKHGQDHQYAAAGAGAAAADNLMGGRDRYSGGSSGDGSVTDTNRRVRSGYYDGLARVDDQGVPMRTLPPQISTRPLSPQHQQRYSPSTQWPGAQGHPPPLQQQQFQQQQLQQQQLYQEQQQLYQQQQQQLQQQQLQLQQQQLQQQERQKVQQQQQQLYEQQQQLYQEQLLQDRLLRGHEASLQAYNNTMDHTGKPSFDDNRTSAFSTTDISHLNYLNHSQMSSASPYSAIDRNPGQRDSTTSSSYSESRNPQTVSFSEQPAARPLPVPPAQASPQPRQGKAPQSRSAYPVPPPPLPTSYVPPPRP